MTVKICSIPLFGCTGRHQENSGSLWDSVNATGLAMSRSLGRWQGQCAQQGVVLPLVFCIHWKLSPIWNRLDRNCTCRSGMAHVRRDAQVWPKDMMPRASIWGRDAFRDSLVLNSKEIPALVFYVFPTNFKVWFYDLVSVCHSAQQASFLGCDFSCQNQAPWKTSIEAFILLVWNPTNSPTCRSLNRQLPPRDGTLQ